MRQIYIFFLTNQDLGLESHPLVFHSEHVPNNPYPQIQVVYRPTSIKVNIMIIVVEFLNTVDFWIPQS